MILASIITPVVAVIIAAVTQGIDQHRAWLASKTPEERAAIRTAEKAATWAATAAAAVALHESNKRNRARLSPSVTGTGPPPGKAGAAMWAARQRDQTAPEHQELLDAVRQSGQPQGTQTSSQSAGSRLALSSKPGHASPPGQPSSAAGSWAGSSTTSGGQSLDMRGHRAVPGMSQADSPSLLHGRMLNATTPPRPGRPPRRGILSLRVAHRPLWSVMPRPPGQARLCSAGAGTRDKSKAARPRGETVPGAAVAAPVHMADGRSPPAVA